MASDLSYIVAPKTALKMQGEAAPMQNRVGTVTSFVWRVSLLVLQ